jgi:methionyl-tRNA formyltransferase
VFLGTPDAAVVPLEALVAAGHDVALVVTRADKRRGRGSTVLPSPVKEAATGLGIPVSHRVDAVLEVGASLGVVVAFGQIIKPHVLAAVPMVNLHFSLLPRWRGAAPVERALLAGDAETGVCVMEVEEGLDTGGVYALTRVPISPTDTVVSLRERLVAAGTTLLVDTLATALGTPTPQAGEPTYADKITPADLHLDWTLPAATLARRTRVGKAWTTFRAERFLVLAAHAVAAGGTPGVLHDGVVGTADGGLALEQVQPAGRAPLSFAEWRNGARPADGEQFGE